MLARRRLWHTYALWISALVTLVLAASGVAQLWLIQRETRTAVEAQQALEANRASARIDRFMREAGTLLRASLSLLDSGHIGEVDADVQVELLRLMRQAPAIDELYWIDPHGTERVRVSRMGSDRVGTGEDRSGLPEFLNARADAPWFGPVTYTGNQPRVVMARRGWREHSGVLAANLDLAQLRNIIDDTRFGREGHAYLVDGEGHLLAHPEFLQVLARPDWTARPAVQAAIADDSADPGDLVEFDTPEGESVVAYFTKLSVPGWRLITEQPRDEAFAPVYRALATALLILVLAVLAGSAVGTVLARRVVHPIQQLAEGADRIGEGQLEHRIELARGDELGQLAETINTMGDDIHQMLEAKRALLLAMSHELRSPLTRARLNTELLPETADVQPQRLALMRDLGEMAGLITDLLESERLAGRHAALHREPTDVAELAREVVADLCSRHAGASDIALHAAPDLPAVRLDRSRLRLLLRNLLDNSLRHSESGAFPPELHLRLVDEGRVLELEVRDHGRGVPPEHLPHLAQAFYRPDTARQRATGGVGLGLYLCRLVAQAHDGQLNMRNAEPGLSVTVRLPVVE